MRLLPRTRRGTWLLAGTVWLAACAVMWWALPVVPRAIIQVDPQTRWFDFAPDGTALITFGWGKQPEVESSSASVFGQFRRWESSSGSQIGETIQAWDFLVRQRVSPDRRWWFLGPAGASDGRIQLLDVVNWRIDTLPIVGPDSSHPEFSLSAAFSPDNQLLIVENASSNQFGLAVWNIDKRDMEAVIPDLQLPAACSADGRLLAATTRHPKDGAIVRIFERSGLRPVVSLLAGPQERFDYVAFSRDGALAIALLRTDLDAPGEFGFIGSRGLQRHRTLRCWDVKSGTERFTMSDVYGEFAIVDRDRSILAIHDDQEGQCLRWHDAATGRLQNVGSILGETLGLLTHDSLNGNGKWIAIPFYSLDTSFLASLAARINLTLPINLESMRLRTRLYDTVSNRPLCDLPASNPRWSPDGQTLATFVDDKFTGRIGLWDIPPRKSATWFAAGAALLALPIAFVARRRVRQLRAA